MKGACLMANFYLILDAFMCFLWIATYTLVLIGTLRYKYPLIAPLTQAIIAPFEFSVLLYFIKLSAFRFDYASIAYLYWSMIEIAIIFVMIKKRYIQKKWIIPYIGAVVALTILMVYFVIIMGKMLFFSYANTFVGVAVWMAFILKRKDYPINPFTLTVFCLKFLADILGGIVYFGKGHCLINILCVCLPILDSVFIYIYLKKRAKKFELTFEMQASAREIHEM